MPQQPPNPAQQMEMNHAKAQLLNQNVAAQSASGASSVASSSAPQLVDVEYAKSYYSEIQRMFVSGEFKNAERKDKKEIVGNIIYKHVEKIVGEAKAPKITGMLIDLPEAELNFSVSQWNHFEQKVMSAFQLISSQNQESAPGGAVAPEALKA